MCTQAIPQEMGIGSIVIPVMIAKDVHDRLKELHGTEARQRTSTGNKITFSSFVEELLADYVRETVRFKRAMANLDKMDNSEFE